MSGKLNNTSVCASGTTSCLVIRGTAADSDGSIASMSGKLNNTSVCASGTTSWSVNAALKTGRNTIKVQSVDNLGLRSSFVTVTRRGGADEENDR